MEIPMNEHAQAIGMRLGAAGIPDPFIWGFLRHGWMAHPDIREVLGEQTIRDYQLFIKRERSRR